MPLTQRESYSGKTLLARRFATPNYLGDHVLSGPPKPEQLIRPAKRGSQTKHTPPFQPGLIILMLQWLSLCNLTTRLWLLTGAFRRDSWCLASWLRRSALQEARCWRVI